MTNQLQYTGVEYTPWNKLDDVKGYVNVVGLVVNRTDLKLTKYKKPYFNFIISNIDFPAARMQVKVFENAQNLDAVVHNQDVVEMIRFARVLNSPRDQEFDHTGGTHRLEAGALSIVQIRQTVKPVVAAYLQNAIDALTAPDASPTLRVPVSCILMTLKGMAVTQGVTNTRPWVKGVFNVMDSHGKQMEITLFGNELNSFLNVVDVRLEDQKMTPQFGRLYGVIGAELYWDTRNKKQEMCLDVSKTARVLQGASRITEMFTNSSQIFHEFQLMIIPEDKQVGNAQKAKANIGSIADAMSQQDVEVRALCTVTPVCNNKYSYTGCSVCKGSRRLACKCQNGLQPGKAAPPEAKFWKIRVELYDDSVVAPVEAGCMGGCAQIVMGGYTVDQFEALEQQSMRLRPGEVDKSQLVFKTPVLFECIVVNKTGQYAGLEVPFLKLPSPQELADWNVVIEKRKEAKKVETFE